VIMICYDGSGHARAAVKQAGILMPGHSAIVLTVYGRGGAGAEPAAPATADQARAAATAGHGVLLGRQLGIDCEPRTLRDRSTVAATIVAEAACVGATAVIVGRGGGRPPGTHALGSVAEAVVRDAHCAVLVASPAAGMAVAPVAHTRTGLAA
jgi:nucleotide-binding universal stress UspA family protein